MIDFSITICDYFEGMADTVRFLSHIILLHLLTYFIGDDHNNKLFNRDVLKSLVFTAVAVMLWHIFVKKLIIRPIKKLKSACDVTKDIESKDSNSVVIGNLERITYKPK